MELGLTMSDLDEIPWGELVLMLQAKAQAFEEEKEEPEEATFDQIAAYFGVK